MDQYQVTFRKPKEFQTEFLDSLARYITVEAPGIVPAIDKAIAQHAQDYPGRNLGYIITAVRLIEKEGDF